MLASRTVERGATEVPARDDRVRVVTLDLWHTLFYLEPEEEERYMEAQLELATAILDGAPPFPGEPVVPREGLRAAFAQEFARAVEASQAGRTVTPAEQLGRAARKTGRRLEPSEYVQGLHDLVGRTPFRAAPGAREMLEALRASGYRTAVISNTTGEPGAALRPVLSRLGFDGCFDALVFSDERPWTKPAAEIFESALAPLRGTPERAVHVGDGWTDIEGARRARFRGGILFTGLQSYGQHYQRLFLPGGWDNPPTPYRTDQLSEVPAIVEELLARTPNGGPEL